MILLLCLFHHHHHYTQKYLYNIFIYFSVFLNWILFFGSNCSFDHIRFTIFNSLLDISQTECSDFCVFFCRFKFYLLVFFSCRRKFDQTIWVFKFLSKNFYTKILNNIDMQCSSKHCKIFDFNADFFFVNLKCCSFDFHCVHTRISRITQILLKLFFVRFRSRLDKQNQLSIKMTSKIFFLHEEFC